MVQPTTKSMILTAPLPAHNTPMFVDHRIPAYAKLWREADSQVLWVLNHRQTIAWPLGPQGQLLEGGGGLVWGRR